jgi:hypothetical protein
MAMTPTHDPATRSASTIVDFDIHGLVGIRLVDPSPSDLTAVSALIGPPAALSQAPDLTIRFVDDLGPAEPVRWIEPDSMGFGAEGLFLYTAASRAGPAGCLRLEAPGPRWELRCRARQGSVPFLVPLLDLAVSAKGVFALHASAFMYKGSGVVVAGLARSGKTTALLAFMGEGAAYIGDDRVYLHAAGRGIYGLPQPLSVRAAHLSELPDLARTVGGRGRSRLRLCTVVERTASLAARIESFGDLPRRVAAAASDAAVSVSPARLFGECPLQGRLDKAFLAIAHDSPDVRVEPVEPQHLAERLLFSIRAERLPLWRLYYAFRFAFPEHAEVFGEEDEEAETERLAEALEGTETYALYHPFPAPVQAIHDALAPVLG